MTHAAVREDPNPTSGEERRAHERYSVLESGVILMDGGAVDCQVIDVSASGARVRPVGRLPKDLKSCRFVLARLGQFKAVVRWCAGDQAGVSFEAEPDDVRQRCQPLFGGFQPA